MAEWVKVEFYGLVPDGQTVTDVDLLKVGETLELAFGFTHVDRLSASKVTSPTAR